MKTQTGQLAASFFRASTLAEMASFAENTADTIRRERAEIEGGSIAWHKNWDDEYQFKKFAECLRHMETASRAATS